MIFKDNFFTPKREQGDNEMLERWAETRIKMRMLMVVVMLEMLIFKKARERTLGLVLLSDLQV